MPETRYFITMDSQFIYVDADSIQESNVQRIAKFVYAVDVNDYARPRKRMADRLMDRIEVWTPIKLREELLGDIREDVEHRREQGWAEKRIRRLIWWQFGYAITGWLWGRMERVLELIPRSGK
jgi:hypothetical protein